MANSKNKMLFRVIISAVGIGIFFMLMWGLGKNDNDDKNYSIVELSDSTVTDIDGNVYHTIKIGTQVWMVENLKVTHYRDGTPIPNVYDNDEWQYATNGAYCMVNNDSIEYKNIYGLLYNYYAVNSSHYLCPEGWHVPSEAECLTLINYLGGKDVAGCKIKDNSSNLWNNKNACATNKSGFSGLPAGGRGKLGSPGDVGYYTTWWSSTSHDSLYAWHWGLYPDKPGIRSNPGHKASGFSVRCIKD
jgi:uncharacterized protein (TIGR02145 family)